MSQLSGMKAICQYVKRSEPTVLDWIRNMGFPAKKIGGIWESDKELIQKWRLTNLGQESGKEKKKPRPSGGRS